MAAVGGTPRERAERALASARGEYERQRQELIALGSELAGAELLAAQDLLPHDDHRLRVLRRLVEVRGSALTEARQQVVDAEAALPGGTG